MIPNSKFLGDNLTLRRFWDSPRDRHTNVAVYVNIFNIFLDQLDIGEF